MNAVAMQPEWLPVVEQCEMQFGSVEGLPTIDELGPGVWNCQKGGITKDGVNCILYWHAGADWRTRRHVRVGSFRLAQGKTQARPRHNDQTGILTVAFDDQGRRLIRIRTDPKAKDFRIVAVEKEQHRGAALPRVTPAVELGNTWPALLIVGAEVSIVARWCATGTW